MEVLLVLGIGVGVKEFIQNIKHWKNDWKGHLMDSQLAVYIQVQVEKLGKRFLKVNLSSKLKINLI
jgi:hypothetical protein